MPKKKGQEEGELINLESSPKLSSSSYEGTAKAEKATSQPVGDVGEASASSKKPKKNKNPFKAMGKKVWIVVAVAAVILGIVGAGLFNTYFNKGTYVSSATLQKVVNVSDLSTAKFIYNGIAEKSDDNGNTVYHIAYDATVNAGISMQDITFDVDDAKKTVTPILPTITIDNPVIDESSLEYLPENPNADLKEVITICKADALSEAQQNSQIYSTARENLKMTVEVLIKPLLDSEGYTIDWKESDTANSSTEQAATSEGSATTEGSTNETN